MAKWTAKEDHVATGTLFYWEELLPVETTLFYWEEAVGNIATPAWATEEEEETSDLDWCMPRSGEDIGIASTLSFGGAVEDLNINPEDMCLEPELIQSDCDSWQVADEVIEDEC